MKKLLLMTSLLTLGFNYANATNYIGCYFQNKTAQPMKVFLIAISQSPIAAGSQPYTVTVQANSTYPITTVTSNEGESINMINNILETFSEEAIKAAVAAVVEEAMPPISGTNGEAVPDMSDSSNSFDQQITNAKNTISSKVNNWGQSVTGGCIYFYMNQDGAITYAGMVWHSDLVGALTDNVLDLGYSQMTPNGTARYIVTTTYDGF